MRERLTVVFDISATPLPWMILVLPGLGALAVAVLVLVRLRLTESGPRWARLVAWAFCFSAVVWAVNWSGMGISRELKARKAIKDGNAAVVGGRVRDFVPEPAHGHASEHFSVNGITFWYAYSVLKPGFHTSQPHGGPIREGQYVRVHYVGDDILKLEIAGE